MRKSKFSQDSAFGTLNIWQDANENGITDAGELKNLTQAGVESISLSYTDTVYSITNPAFAKSNIVYQTDDNNNEHRQLGSYTAIDGSTQADTDVWMQVNKMDSIALNTVTVSAEIEALPDIQGFGNLNSLHQAMASNDVRRLIAL